MASNEYMPEYKSEALLAELRAAIPSNSVESYEVCQLQNKIVCDHLTTEQYASLKATKRTLTAETDNYRVYECGHVYRALCRVAHVYLGPKEKTAGLCSQCWRYLTTDGKRIRLDHRGKRRPKNPNAKLRSRNIDTRPRPRRGPYRIWRVRGHMMGERKV
ncbi:hypothetical protein F5Y03DRAFT_410367 [Xylaria venustula]|nr:hypothetical protein F5Y03DRAFT_410367 [Xylaria venustula]